MYKIKKVFTSRDGKLEVDNREYGMTQEGLDLIGDARNELGGATHIFVRVDGGPSNEVDFFTRDNQFHFTRSEKPESGWAVWDLDKGAVYKPEKGERGWWNVTVAGAPSDVVDGLGLPDSWHVSTFIIFEWQETNAPDVPGDDDDGPEIPENPEPPVYNPNKKIIMYLYDDGTWQRVYQ